MNARDIQPEHFRWSLHDRVATITLDRPEKKNPLTFASYAELRDTLRAVAGRDDIRAVVITGAGGNFSSGGDVHEIIGPLVKMEASRLREFTQMTGDVVIAMQMCPQVIVAAVDGVCAGAGAAIAMSADLRLGTARARVAFLFVRVGLAGCDMGACALLPRIVGQGRAAELLYTGRFMAGAEALAAGFFNRLVEPDALDAEAARLAKALADGPTRAHALTKKMLREEWDMGVVDAIQAEALAQAQCMQTADFRRAYEAFVARREPRFEGD